MARRRSWQSCSPPPRGKSEGKTEDQTPLPPTQAPSRSRDRLRRVRRLQGGVLRSSESTCLPESRLGHEMRSIGGPEPRPDTSAALKRDAADAATDYRKPGPFRPTLTCIRLFPATAAFRPIAVIRPAKAEDSNAAVAVIHGYASDGRSQLHARRSVAIEHVKPRRSTGLQQEHLKSSLRGAASRSSPGRPQFPCGGDGPHRARLLLRPSPPGAASRERQFCGGLSSESSPHEEALTAL